MKKLILLIALLYNLLASNQINNNFTKIEKEYISSNTFTIGMVVDNYPFSFKVKDRIKGYSYDYLNLIIKKSGLKIKIKMDNWTNTLNKFKTKQLDLIDVISHKKNRESFTNFSKPYFEIPSVIFARKGEFNNYTGFESLKGKKIAITKDQYYYDDINNLQLFDLIEFTNSRDKIKALAYGKVDVIFHNLITAQRYIKSAGYANIKILDELDPLIVKKEDLRIGIKKEDKILFSIINKSIESISTEEKDILINKWFAAKIEKKTFISNINLTEKEKNYLTEKKILDVCVNSENMPFEKMDNNKKYIGWSSDYFNMISKLMNTSINVIWTKSSMDSLLKLENKECDIVSMIPTSLLNNSTNHIYKYLDSKILIASKSREIYINDINNYIGEVFAIQNDSDYYGELKKQYPQLKLVKVDSLEVGLDMVERGDVFGYIDDALRLSYLIKRNYTGRISIVGRLDNNVSYNIVSRKDTKILNEVLTKVIHSIPINERIGIDNKWLNLNEKGLIDYTLIIEIIIIFLFIIIFLIFFLKKTNKLKNKIENLNKVLNSKIKQEIQENHEKDMTIYKQSKLIGMGEMISNIAHQWRQPLSEINSVIMNLESDFYNNKLNKKSLENNLEQIEKLTEHMSNTIDNFYDFFNNDKVKTKFLISKNLNKVFDLFENTFKKSNIKIESNIKDDVILETYEGEFLQVLIILLQNSKDAFITNNTQKSVIYVDVTNVDNNLLISIKDNAGGIKSEIIDKIFEPYFTTKLHGQGLGLGLYLSKQIVEKSMHSRLEVRSNGDITIFTIIISL